MAKVLSTIRGMAWRWAAPAASSTSVTSQLGLPSVSMNTSRVSSLMASSSAPGRRGSTKVQPMP